MEGNCVFLESTEALGIVVKHISYVYCGNICHNTSCVAYNSACNIDIAGISKVFLAIFKVRRYINFTEKGWHLKIDLNLGIRSILTIIDGQQIYYMIGGWLCTYRFCVAVCKI